ncbi:MAG: tail fiber domain-containing protein [Bacteroidota bacterium]|jgi:hypothetical protein
MNISHSFLAHVKHFWRTTGLCVLLFAAVSLPALAQGVAINATNADPDASAILDLASTVKGFLAPRMTAAQRTAISAPAAGLLVYQTDAPAGFYFFDGSCWFQVGTTSIGSLDHAYDFGGAGLGSTITADAGAVKIAGVDGFVVTGTVASGTIPATGAGTRMMWYPGKAAFRAGRADGDEWDDSNIGYFSFAVGNIAQASGSNSVALGSGTASGSGAVALGTGGAGVASGDGAIAIGSGASATYLMATAIGSQSEANAQYSTVLGWDCLANSQGETVVGSYNAAPGMNNRGWSPSDPIFEIGNGDPLNSPRSNAMTVLKNGNVGIGVLDPDALLEVAGQVKITGGTPGTGRILTSDATGLASWEAAAGDVSAVGSMTSGAVFADATADDDWLGLGAAAGRIEFDDQTTDEINFVDANVGIGTSAPTAKLQVNGQVKIVDGSQGANKVLMSDANGLAAWTTPPASGNLDQSYDFGGAGAGRTITADAGPVLINGVDGLLSTGINPGLALVQSIGAGTRMHWYPKKSAFRAGTVNGTQWDNDWAGQYSAAFGYNSIASGSSSAALGSGNTASGVSALAAGSATLASGQGSVSVGVSTEASGPYSLASGANTTASGSVSTAMGSGSVASGEYSLALGSNTIAESFMSMALGRFNVGGGSPTSWISTDPLFALGIGYDNTSRANAITVLKNGNVGIGLVAPSTKLEVAGQVKITGGSPGAGKVLTSDANGLANWAAPTAPSVTLDEAYDNSPTGDKTIIADMGAVKITGTDGFLCSGTHGSGQIHNPNAGSRMHWYPRKSAFRAGGVSSTQWDDVVVGSYSTAFGYDTRASGLYAIAMGAGTIATASGATAIGNSTDAVAENSTAMGNGTTASGSASTAMGSATVASGSVSTAMGNGATASGTASTAMGEQSVASGSNATAMGYSTLASSYATTSLGRYNLGGGNSTSWVSTDPLFEIGIGTGSSARANALTVLKNGNVGIGLHNPAAELEVSGLVKVNGQVRIYDGSQGAGKVLTSDASGLAAWTTPLASGNLDQSYDFGGAGAGRTITADAGPVTIEGMDGLLSTGINSGAALVQSIGAGTRMHWYPKQSAFRAGTVSGTQWDDASVGQYSAAFGYNATASGSSSAALGSGSTASGFYALAAGNGTLASGQNSISLGFSTEASGGYSFASGANTTASGNVSTAMGSESVASGVFSIALGHYTLAESYMSTALGRFNVGGGSPTAWVPTDPLFALGIGVDNTSRANAVTVLKNGNVGIGLVTPSTKLEVAGQIKITGGSPASGKVLTSDASGLASWEDVAVDIIAVGSMTSGAVFADATADDDWLGLGGSSGHIEFDDQSTDEVNILNANVGIGTSTPSTKLEVAGQIKITGGSPASGKVLTSDASGLASWQTPTLVGGLDDAYDYGTPGGGRTINATNGAVEIAGLDGFVSTGINGSGPIPATGAGTRMMWYPGKAAFRAGSVSSTQWDDASIGANSIALGSNSIASGIYSSAIGNGASATAYGATAIGVSVTAGGSHSLALGSYVSTGGNQGSCVIGDYGVASPMTSSTTNEMSMRFAGGYRLFSNQALTTGVYMTGGVSGWMNYSDRNKKENFRDIDGEMLLSRIRAIPVTEWNYKGSDPSVRYIGPMAQDFWQAFRLGGTDSLGINTISIDGVNFAAVKALEERTRELQLANQELDAVKQRLERLESEVARMGTLQSRLDALEAAMRQSRETPAIRTVSAR